MKYSINILILCYCFSALAFYGIEGSTIIPKSIGFLLVGFFLFSIGGGDRKIKVILPIHVRMYSLFVVFALTSAVFFLPYSWGYLQTLLQLSILVVIIISSISSNGQTYWIEVGVILGVIFLIFSQVLEGRSLLINEIGNRTGGNVGNENNYAHVMIMAVLFSLNRYILLLKKTYKKYIRVSLQFFFLGVALLATNEAIFFSGSRTAIIVLLFIYLVFLVLILRDVSIITKLSILFFLIYLGVTAYTIFLETSFFLRFEKLIEYSQGNTLADQSTRIRSGLIGESLRLWEKSPIWGIGFDQFRYQNNLFQTYAHNTYAELLANFGLIGITLYYMIHILTLNSLFKIRRILVSKRMEIDWIITMVLVLLILDFARVTYVSKLYWIQFAYIISFITYEKRQIKKRVSR